MNLYGQVAQPLSSMPGRISNLPPQNKFFIGREEALHQIHERLQASEGTGAVVGIVPLQGMSGVGKTQLALEYAYLHRDEYAVVWWVNAQNASVATTDLIHLAAWLGVPTNVEPETVISQLWTALAARDDWLLVFDNIDDEAVLMRFRPPSTGHRLLTGRSSVLGRLADLLEVAEFSRSESIELLRRRCPALNAEEAAKVAAELGDLPLAIEQAGCFLRENDFDVTDYLALLAEQPAKAGLSDPTLDRHPGLIAVFTASQSRLREISPVSAELLNQLAFLAPEPLPLGSSSRFGVKIGDPVTAASAVRHLTAFGLVRHPGHSVLVHRLVQALGRALLSPSACSETLLSAQRLLASAVPGDARDPATWPAFAAIVPHVQIVNDRLTQLSESADEDVKFRALLIASADYLRWSGQYSLALVLAETAYQRWSQSLGVDHPDTLSAGHTLAGALRSLGHNGAARDMYLSILDQRRRILGTSNPDTLKTANELALTLYRLGEFEPARDLCQDTLEHREVLGEDHPAMLGAMGSLSAALSGLKDYTRARDLDQDSYTRRQRLLGPDHPDTLASAHSLAFSLGDLGEHREAADLGRAVLEGRRRVLGADHPGTLWSMYSLAVDLLSLGEYREAADLDRAALEGRRRVLGADHADTLSSMNNLAVGLSNLSEYGEAVSVGRDVLERGRRVLGEDDQETQRYRSNLRVYLAAADRSNRQESA